MPSLWGWAFNELSVNCKLNTVLVVKYYMSSVFNLIITYIVRVN